MKPPTEKQLSFAKIIATELMIELPEEKTRQSLFLFIRDNKPKFDDRQRKRRWDWTECLDRDEDLDIADAMGIDILTGCIGDD